MNEPRATRPRFPDGYVSNPTAFVPWSQIVERLSSAKNYWLCSIRPEGRPHAVPKWGVWVDGKVYFDGSYETRHAKNIAANPQVVLHLESGDSALIVEGLAQSLAKPSPELAGKIAHEYREKYAALGYAPKPDQWDEGGLFEITPCVIFSWTEFKKDPTKFVLEQNP
jgi:nitroimidazol reductase NimA-like FMN-containing flavoprotein (pyridoxamine 5'-phosphate oxidase superfamily)